MNRPIMSFAIVLCSLFANVASYAGCSPASDTDPSQVSVSGTSTSYAQSDGGGIITTIGTFKNSSSAFIEDIVVEVKYFNAANNLIDVVTQPLYGLVLPPGEEVAFRVRDSADKPKSAYATSTVRVVSAQQRPVRQPQQPQSKPSTFWSDLFYSWGPMLLLIAVYVFYMAKFAGKKSPQARTVDLITQQNSMLGRQIDVIERIAVVAEKSVSKPE